jgi:hypothetical protein
MVEVAVRYQHMVERLMPQTRCREAFVQRDPRQAGIDQHGTLAGAHERGISLAPGR